MEVKRKLAVKCPRSSWIAFVSDLAAVWNERRFVEFHFPGRWSFVLWNHEIVKKFRARQAFQTQGQNTHTSFHSPGPQILLSSSSQGKKSSQRRLPSTCRKDWCPSWWMQWTPWLTRCTTCTKTAVEEPEKSVPRCCPWLGPGYWSTFVMSASKVGKWTMPQGKWTQMSHSGRLRSARMIQIGLIWHCRVPGRDTMLVSVCFLAVSGVVVSFFVLPWKQSHAFVCSGKLSS